MFYRALLRLAKWKQMHGLKMARATASALFLPNPCAICYFTSKCVSSAE